METQYLEAVNAEGLEKRLQVARLNLTDPNLSRYYRMKNLLLVAGAEDDWYERERSRRDIVEIWRTANQLTDEGDEPAQKALGEIREKLNDLTQRLHESAPVPIDESLLAEALGDDDDAGSEAPSETDVYGDDQASVRAAELEVFGDDSNIVAMYERAAAAGRAAREAREEAAARGDEEEPLEVSRQAIETVLPNVTS